MPVTKEAVREALRGVPAPDGAPSLADSPALSEIAVVGEKVAFAISAPPERAAALESVRRAAERAVKAMPGVAEVMVALTAERAPSRPAPGPPPAHGHGHGAAGEGARARTPRSIEIPGVRHIVAVASGKGGVGKSTTAANMALALAQDGVKVGVLDADVFGPSMPTVFGLKGKPEAVGGVIQPLRAFEMPIMSIGLLVDPESAMIWRGPMVMSALTQLLREVAWGQLDLLVVDMPPGTGDAQLTMAQQVRLAGAVIVSTPQDLALADARRGIAMFRRVDVPILGVVENMSYFCCPNCGHRAELFGHGGARKEAERLGVPFLGEIPLEAKIRELSDAGIPVVAAEPDSAVAGAYRKAARAMWEGVLGTPGRAPPRIVIE
jgi:ATP-binding protein involved in chromosome partitioning